MGSAGESSTGTAGILMVVPVGKLVAASAAGAGKLVWELELWWGAGGANRSPSSMDSELIFVFVGKRCHSLEHGTTNFSLIGRERSEDFG